MTEAALEARTECRAADHPNVAATPQQLAALHRSTNRPVEAEVLEARAVKIRAINRCPSPRHVTC